MADVTISSLTQGTPGSTASIPFSDGGVTKRVTPNLLLANAGNVGIGTASPTQQLDVNGVITSDYLTIRPQNSLGEGGEIQLQGSGGFGGFQIDNLNGNCRIHTLASGKHLQVLGGGIYANENLAVAGGVTLLGTHPTYGSGYSAFWRNGADYSVLTDGSNTFLNAPGGNIYFRRNNGDLMYLTGNRLYLNGIGSCNSGSGYAIVSPDDSIGAAVRRGGTSGHIEWQTPGFAVGTSYFYSDERVKENIVPSSRVALSVVNNIKTISFDWKPQSGNNGHIDIGFSGQQLKQLDSRFVNELSDGGLMVSEPTLLPYLTKAIQELSQKVEALERRIAG